MATGASRLANYRDLNYIRLYLPDYTFMRNCFHYLILLVKGYLLLMILETRPCILPTRIGDSKKTGSLLSSSVTQMVISSLPVKTLPATTLTANFIVRKVP